MNHFHWRHISTVQYWFFTMKYYFCAVSVKCIWTRGPSGKWTVHCNYQIGKFELLYRCGLCIQPTFWCRDNFTDVRKSCTSASSPHLSQYGDQRSSLLSPNYTYTGHWPLYRMVLMHHFERIVKSLICLILEHSWHAFGQVAGHSTTRLFKQSIFDRLVGSLKFYQHLYV